MTKKAKPQPKTARVAREFRIPEYRYRELIAAVGTDDEVQKAISEAGFDPPPASTIRGWRTRNSIPSAWVPLLIAHAMTMGKLTSPIMLLREGKTVSRRAGAAPAISKDEVVA
jgi:hypothetical protein